jgi:hypothetical protein
MSPASLNLAELTIDFDYDRCGVGQADLAFSDGWRGLRRAPMAFAVDGKEYVAIAAGNAVHAFGLP